MAVLKYKNEQGEFVTLTNYTVQPIIPVQTTGDSLSDVMSQKAVSDGLEKKVDNDELDGKIADAIAESDAVISAITKVISGDSAVSGAVETIVTEKLENYYTSAETKEYISGYTYSKGDIDASLSGKSDVGHTHVVADITDFESGVSSAITNNGDVISSITNVVSSAITSNTEVKNEIISAVTASTEFTTINNNVNTVSGNVETISGNVNTISGNVNTLSGTVTAHTANTTIHFTASSGITSMAGYSKASAAADIATGDTLNVAMGKLEKKIDNAVAGGVSSVSIGSGSTNGSLTLTVNGTVQDTISVPGLGGAAFLSTGTTAGTVAAGNHTHLASAITDFNSAVSGAVKNNADVKTEIISAVTSSTEFTTISGDVYSISGDVETISGNVNTLSGTVTAHTADTTIHVTSGEKTAWNAKSDFSGSYADLTNVPSAFTPTEHTHASSAITTMAGYVKAASAADIATGDTLNVAMGKLEKKIDSAVAGGVSSVSLGSGSTNGTLTLTVNGALQDTVNVPGLGEAAFLNTGTTAGTVAAGNHTHVASDITDFNSAVSGAVKNNTDVKNEIISAVTASTAFTTISGDVYSISGDVNTISGNVTTISGVAYSANAFADFCSGHNTVSTLANLPTNKRLIIASGITSSTNELSLSGGTLSDGYELHVIINGTSDVSVTIPSTWITISDSISIGSNGYCEINIISDGTKLYVRGA